MGEIGALRDAAEVLDREILVKGGEPEEIHVLNPPFQRGREEPLWGGGVGSERMSL